MAEGLRETPVTFEAGGAELEGVVARRETDSPGPGIVLLAPHPRYGGAMDNNVVMHLARRAAEEGCVTLRFNFSGVGGSGANPPGGVSIDQLWTLMDEAKDYRPMLPDAVGALGCLRRETASGGRVIVLGYSLGAVVGGLLAKEASPDALIGVSPPVSQIPLPMYRDCAMPKRFVWGDSDSVCSHTDFQAFYEALPGEKTFETLAGCDHFFGGQEERIYQSLRGFLLA